jgi:hypothetical protein
MKSASGLAQFAQKVLDEKWLYMYGGYGQVIGGIRRADCYGIRKAYSWDRGNFSRYTGSDDRNVKTAYNIAKVKGKIGKLDLKPGMIVAKYYYSKLGMGHAGIYVGNGWVIDIYKTGLPARRTQVDSYAWTHCFEDTSIDYSEYDSVIPELSRILKLRIPRMRGEDVRAMQKKLNDRGYSDSTGNVLAEDGIYGKKTDYAVRQFQKENAAQLDMRYVGLVGKKTWGVLFG